MVLFFIRIEFLFQSTQHYNQIVLAEYHSTHIGGHAGMQRTLARISSTFYWPRMKESVREYVLKCQICQEAKPFNKAPQGLLQPLPIPGKIWDCISIDFTPIYHYVPGKPQYSLLWIVSLNIVISAHWVRTLPLHRLLKFSFVMSPNTMGFHHQ